jgi:hypothetical protein
MSSEAQVALVVGIVSAIAALSGALGGTLLGWVLNRRTQTREEKRAAFVELLSAMLDCQHGALRLHQAMQGTVPAETKRERDLMLAAVRRVDTASNIAALALSAQHDQALNDAVTACVNAYIKAAEPPPMTSNLDTTLHAVRALARRELA